MSTSPAFSPRQKLQRAALIALGCTIGLTLAPLASAGGLDSTTAQPRADAAAKMPLKATFQKLTDGTTPPYVLKLTNDSKASLKVTGKVLLAVVHHNADKARMVPEHVIETGKTWTISELAAEDKVILTAEGFAPLELVVK